MYTLQRWMYTSGWVCVLWRSTCGFDIVCFGLGFELAACHFHVCDNVGLVVFRDSRVYIYLSIFFAANCPSVFSFPGCKQISCLIIFDESYSIPFCTVFFVLEDWRDTQGVGTSGSYALINFSMNTCPLRMIVEMWGLYFLYLTHICQPNTYIQ